MSKAFIPQERLEDWVETGDVQFEGNRLRLKRSDGEYVLDAAVRVQSVIDGEDTGSLVGKVCTIAYLESQQADISTGCVILGETAYECLDGYRVILPETKPEAQTPSAPTLTQETNPASTESAIAAATGSEAESGEEGDSDLLADFLLKHL